MNLPELGRDVNLLRFGWDEHLPRLGRDVNLPRLARGVNSSRFGRDVTLPELGRRIGGQELGFVRDLNKYDNLKTKNYLLVCEGNPVLVFSGLLI